MITPMLLATKIGIYQYIFTQIIENDDLTPEARKPIIDLRDTLRETQLFLYEAARNDILKEMEGYDG